MIGYQEENSKEELKRVDHLIYVSLKYTRTCDVIKNVIKRLISAFNYKINDIVRYAKEKGKIKDMPISMKEKLEIVNKLMSKVGSAKYVKLYELLKMIDIAECERKCEFRKHVVLIAKVKNKKVPVKVDTLLKYFEQTKEFVNIADKWMKR